MFLWPTAWYMLWWQILSKHQSAHWLMLNSHLLLEQKLKKMLKLVLCHRTMNLASEIRDQYNGVLIPSWFRWEKNRNEDQWIVFISTILNSIILYFQNVASEWLIHRAGFITSSISIANAVFGNWPIVWRSAVLTADKSNKNVLVEW